jgi:hypothetical protein
VDECLILVDECLIPVDECLIPVDECLILIHSQYGSGNPASNHAPDTVCTRRLPLRLKL